MKEIYGIRSRYDVFHFNFGSSLVDVRRLGLHLLDLPLYKGKGKIVVTYNECDARQKYPTMDRVSFSACHDKNCYGGICSSSDRDEMKRKRITKFDRYADAIFAVNPDLIYFLPKRTSFLPYAISDWDSIETVPYHGTGRSLKIVHSPTNRAAKGSDLILQCLEQAQKKYGEAIEVILVENLPNAEARRVYSQADLGIDQILIGWYGGFAVELMKMGKPVMSFVREEDLQFIPKAMAEDCEKAVVRVEPASLCERLCELIENRDLLLRYREAGLDYVQKWHDPVHVARMTKAVYES
jgi:hypothetical protein